MTYAGCSGCVGYASNVFVQFVCPNSICVRDVCLGGNVVTKGQEVMLLLDDVIISVFSPSFMSLP